MTPLLNPSSTHTSSVFSKDLGANGPGVRRSVVPGHWHFAKDTFDLCVTRPWCSFGQRVRGTTPGAPPAETGPSKRPSGHRRGSAPACRGSVTTCGHGVEVPTSTRCRRRDGHFPSGQVLVCEAQGQELVGVAREGEVPATKVITNRRTCPGRSPTPRSARRVAGSVGEIVHDLERPQIGHPRGWPCRYNAPRLLVVEVEFIDLKGSDGSPRAWVTAAPTVVYTTMHLFEQGHVPRDDPGYGTEMESQPPDGYLGEQVPAFGLVRLFPIDHDDPGWSRLVHLRTGAPNSQYRHPSPPSAMLQVTKDEWRLNHVSLGRSRGHVSSVQETD